MGVDSSPRGLVDSLMGDGGRLADVVAPSLRGAGI